MATVSLWSQDIVGKWKTIDDETGVEKSIVEIYKVNDKIFGKVIEIFNANKRDAICKDCEGEDNNAPVLGLTIIKNMVKTGNVYKQGTITNPEDGKVYDCRLQLDDESDRLQVRGYVSLFFKTQYWIRMN